MSSADDETGISRRSALKALGAAGGISSLGGYGYFSQIASGQTEPVEYDEVATACWIGKQDCGMRARVVNDRVVHLAPDPADECVDGLCPKGVSQIADLYDPYRIKQPLKRVGDSEKGTEGDFEPISWDEAIEEIAADLAPKLESDPRRVHFQIGRVKGAEWHMDGWVNAVEQAYGVNGDDAGLNVRGHGNVCASGNKFAGSRVGAAFTSPEPDFDNTELFLSWGWNATNAGGPHLCNTTYSREIAEAYEDGTEMVVLDPQRRGAGQWCDQWLPIEPGTDLAFFLAINHVLIEEGYIDQWFLKNMSNSPCLVYAEGEREGEVVRADDLSTDVVEGYNSQEDVESPIESPLWTEGEVVYDGESLRTHESALPDDPTIPNDHATAVLETEDELRIEVDGEEVLVETAFERFADHITEYSPEWAAEITDIDAETIRSVAINWGETAQIGATRTVEVDGNTREVPYRPVSMSLYHVSQQELGPPAAQAGILMMVLVGAAEVIGASRTGYANVPDGGPRRQMREAAFNDTLTWEPDGPDLEGTYYHPDANGAYAKVPHVMNNYDRYGLDETVGEPDDMACIVQFANPVGSGPNRRRTINGYAQYDTVVAVDPHMSDTAALVADYILPTTTVDKNENSKGGMSNTHYTTTTRTAPIPQLFDCRDEGDIYKELAAELGAAEEYLENINTAFDLDGADAFDSVDELTVSECLDRAFSEDLKSQAQSRQRPLYERYWYLLEERYNSQGTTPNQDIKVEHSPFGFKWQLYVESFERVGEIVRNEFEEHEEHNSVDFPYIDDINGFPTWREPTMWDSPDEYQYTLFDHKKIEHKQSRSNQNPLLNELDPQSYVRMHPSTAEEVGVEEGDRVTVTSHNAVEDETHEIEGEVMTLEGIKPETICIPPHHTDTLKPNAQALDEGANVNVLFDSTEGYCSWGADQSFHIRVAVEPAGDDA